MPAARIALVSREVAPLAPGGIGAYVAATAELLAPVAELTIFTTARHQRAYERLRAQAGAGGGEDRGPRLPPARFVFVREPHGWEVGGFHNRLHAWSARLWEAIREAYRDRGPDLIEFQDFLGEGCVTVQARRTLAPELRATTVCVRLNCASEMVRILNGAYPAALEERVTFALERHALAGCDHVLWAGGDLLAAYRRFYGRGTLASPRRVRQPFAIAAPQPPPPPPEGRPGERPLRLLYLGRLERRKGVRNLVEAVAGLDRDDLELTIAGADTQTAPLGGSMRELLELEIGADRRVELRGAVPRDEVPALISAHDAVVVPSLWECWPNVGLEALERNRPLIATPTGGLVEMAQPGRSGLLAAGTEPEQLAAVLAAACERRDELAAWVEDGGPRAVYEQLTAPERTREAYLALAAERPRTAERQQTSDMPPSAAARPQRGGSPAAPLVSIVIPYHRLPGFVEHAVASAAAQTHPRTEILLVNDGSFDPVNEILERLRDRYGARLLVQRNSGLGAARNFGISQARGDYVFPLDADNVAHREFVARCVEVLEARPELDYVNSWSRFIDEQGRPWRGIDDGERPLGNASSLLGELNLAGDAAAVIRRSVFEAGHRYDPELTSYEDWSFYRQLRAAGRRGEAIPEPLISYRVRGDSMARRVGEPNRERLDSELAARDRAAALRWTATAPPSPGGDWEERAARAGQAAATRLWRGGREGAGAAAAATRLAAAAPADGRPSGPAWRTALRRPANLVRRSARRAALRILR